MPERERPSPGAPSRRFHWRVLGPIAAAGVVIFFVSLRVGESHDAVVGDGLSYFAYAQSLFVDGDLDCTNQYRILHAPVPSRLRSPTGLALNKYPVGTALLDAPFFLAGRAVTLVGNRLGAGWVTDGSSPPEQIGFALGSIFWALLGLELTVRLVRPIVGEPHATLAAAAWLLASSLPFYIFRDAAYAHACSFFAVSAFLLYDRRAGELGPRAAAILGLLAGLMTLVETQNLLVCVVPLLRRWREIVAAPSRLALALVGALVGFVPQMLVWQVLFGRPIVFSYASDPGSFDFMHPHLVDVLFSTRHGLVTWTPVAGLALVGLVVGAVRDRAIRPYLAAFVLQWLVNASWWSWWFGMSFGSRKFLGLSAIFVLGLALLVRGATHRATRVLLFAVLGLLVVWNVLLALLFVTQLISTSGEVTIGAGDIGRALPRLAEAVLAHVGR